MKSLMLETVLTICTIVGLAAAATLALVLVIAAPFTWLWNVVPVVVFKAPPLGYWQVVGLFMMITLARSAADGAKLSLKLRDQV